MFLGILQTPQLIVERDGKQALSLKPSTGRKHSRRNSSQEAWGSWWGCHSVVRQNSSEEGHFDKDGKEIKPQAMRTSVTMLQAQEAKGREQL